MPCCVLRIALQIVQRRPDSSNSRRTPSPVSVPERADAKRAPSPATSDVSVTSSVTEAVYTKPEGGFGVGLVLGNTAFFVHVLVSVSVVTDVVYEAIRDGAVLVRGVTEGGTIVNLDYFMG